MRFSDIANACNEPAQAFELLALVRFGSHDNQTAAAFDDSRIVRHGVGSAAGRVEMKPHPAPA